MEKIEIDNAIVGGGIIGLAIGAELARQGCSAYIFEMNNIIGSEISSRNSEVIHSGIYYPPESCRGHLCNQGRHLLYEYCLKNNIPHKNCGKLIVATNTLQINILEQLQKNGKEWGMQDIKLMDSNEVKKEEDKVTAVAALQILSTGIIDSHAYMLSLASEIESSGGRILFNHRALKCGQRSDGLELIIETPKETLQIHTKRLFIAAGLWSHALSAKIEGYTASKVPPLTLVKGSYFSCSQRTYFKRLIYPIPVEGGLGVHLTFDMAGAIRFGPDVEWLKTTDPKEIDYSVNLRRVEDFYKAIRCYWPSLPEGSLTPAYSGVRPKLSSKGEPQLDFLIETPLIHKIPGLCILYGIESPGLTSSLAIAKHVVKENPIIF